LDFPLLEYLVLHSSIIIAAVPVHDCLAGACTGDGFDPKTREEANPRPENAANGQRRLGRIFSQPANSHAS
jgi:hypothetical protein